MCVPVYHPSVRIHNTPSPTTHLHIYIYKNTHHSGKDAQQNELLVKRYLREVLVFVHISMCIVCIYMGAERGFDDAVDDRPRPHHKTITPNTHIHTLICQPSPYQHTHTHKHTYRAMPTSTPMSSGPPPASSATRAAPGPRTRAPSPQLRCTKRVRICVYMCMC
jgi:hypothetical protein